MAIAAGLFLLAGPIETKADNDFCTGNEILNAARGFFGETSGGLAAAVERVFGELGRPNAYVLGEEVGARFLLSRVTGTVNSISRMAPSGRSIGRAL